MSDQQTALTSLSSRLTSKNLAKQIFAAELPEQSIRAIPAQALYAALKRNGIQTSSEILEIATIEQCRLMIDFDCWEKSFFHEDNFWQWLEITSEDEGLTMLQKLLKCFDLKIITLLIARYVKYEFFEEPTDQPPAPAFYTPDKGRTWVNITIEDGNKHFLMGRLLALIFETNADLFYQLLSLSTTSTQTILEEESYQDKCKRLSAEGIPDGEVASGVNNPLPESSVLALLKTSSPTPKVVDIQPVEPLIFDTHTIKPLASLFEDVNTLEDLETEITYILNSAIVHWGVEFFEYDKCMHLANKVKGAINIGLEKCMEISSLQAKEIYTRLGLQRIYALGLTQLKNLRMKAKELRKDYTESEIPSELELTLSLASQGFPEIPTFIKFSKQQERGEIEIQTEPCAIEHLSEIFAIEEFAKNL